MLIDILDIEVDKLLVDDAVLGVVTSLLSFELDSRVVVADPLMLLVDDDFWIEAVIIFVGGSWGFPPTIVVMYAPLW